ncbi:hypothetical protein [Brevibacterium sp. UCMA 11754]|uniref:hypothetical protein n=1 Tax=Brevibacterium sp. UCMA 11754 TaxID=2749198 RepID=UPI001F28C3E7|nr:hypothetical protein [Brevibacterium sp. UCMA 11754]MCF2572420.1 hypothetical protein [Brevibacterium sp. UCMA 11754]
MKLARALAVTALSAGLLASGASAATAVPAETLPPTSKAPDGGEGARPQDTSQLSQEKIDNARTIIAVGKGSDLSAQAQKIAVMTALQESSLRNLDSGDKDSAGLFQQRPSYGWGTHEQITDAVYASKSFYGVNPECSNPGLLHIAGWETMDPGAAAQAVQGSGHPDAYDKWETLAEELVDENQDVEPVN